MKKFTVISSIFVGICSFTMGFLPIAQAQYMTPYNPYSTPVTQYNYVQPSYNGPAQVTTPSYGAQPSSCTPIYGYSTLRLGSYGSEVSALQLALSSMGMYSVQSTGYFDYPTFSAVVQFQTTHGLVPDGIVGPHTRSVMQQACGNSYNPYSYGTPVVQPYVQSYPYGVNTYTPPVVQTPLCYSYSYNCNSNNDSSNNSNNLVLDSKSPTSIESDRATLRGTIDQAQGNVRVWLYIDTDRSTVEDEDGDKFNLGDNLSEGDDFEYTRYNLDSDTKYYYSFCGQDNDGNRDCTDVQSFRTDN